ncbi:hypothetical protein D9M71_479800 [compost metagenome]
MRPKGEWRYFSSWVARVLPPADWPSRSMALPTWVSAALEKRGQSTAGLARGTLRSSSLRFSMNSRLLTSNGGMLPKLG